MATTLLACAIILLVLFGPIFIGAIERNLEVFFLAIGFVTAWMMGELKGALVHDVLVEPLSFTLAVLIFGSAFRLGRSYLDRQLARLILVVEPSRICFGLTLLLSALAPFITPVVSALVFVEAIALLRLDRAGRIAVTVLGCFSIGLAAGLTPLGMPGIAVVLRSLQAGFWYLTRLVGPFVAAGSVVVAIPILSLDLKSATRQEAIEPPDPWCVVLLTRPGKIYLFIGGLVALSEGLRPVVDA